MKTKIFAVLALAAGLSSCSDFLDRPPMDQIENSADFYNSENNIRSTIYGWYDIYFTGYQSGWVKSDFFDGTNVANWVDDLAQKEATSLQIQPLQLVPTGLLQTFAVLTLCVTDL